jgi:protein ImuA
LHLAAAEHHKLLFVMRSDQARQDASPAVLRLQLSSHADGGLCLELLKRRGPPLDHSLHLAARTPALRQLLAVANIAQAAAAAQTAPQAAARVRALVLPQAPSRTRSRVAGRAP